MGVVPPEAGSWGAFSVKNLKKSFQLLFYHHHGLAILNNISDGPLLLAGAECTCPAPHDIHYCSEFIHWSLL